MAASQRQRRAGGAAGKDTRVLAARFREGVSEACPVGRASNPTPCRAPPAAPSAASRAARGSGPRARRASGHRRPPRRPARPVPARRRRARRRARPRRPLGTARACAGARTRGQARRSPCRRGSRSRAPRRRARAQARRRAPSGGGGCASEPSMRHPLGACWRVRGAARRPPSSAPAERQASTKQTPRVCAAGARRQRRCLPQRRTA